MFLSPAHLSAFLGEIINWVALDREQRSQHSVKVMVTDQGHPRLNTTTTVHILISDVNDNAPQFTHLPASKELSVHVRLTLSISTHLIKNFGHYLPLLSATCHRLIT